jgi:hypothetical protein
MKRLWLLIALVGCVFKNNAQTTVPFYGFELSNYEVGDTLQYTYTKATGVTGVMCTGYKAWVVLTKSFIAVDTLHYTARHIEKTHCASNQNSYEEDFMLYDTVSWIINNELVYGDSNNIFSYFLAPCDTFLCQGFVFDTVNDQKELSLNVQNFEGDYHYYVKQNLGVILYHFTPWGEIEWSQYVGLTFAKLANNGIYGGWQPMYLNTPEVDHHDLSVLYDAESRLLTLVSNGWIRESFKLRVLGRCVLSSEVNQKTIPVNNLPNGIYIYSISGQKNGKIWIY